jgi:hypothetical protein
VEGVVVALKVEQAVMVGLDLLVLDTGSNKYFDAGE